MTERTEIIPKKCTCATIDDGHAGDCAIFRIDHPEDRDHSDDGSGWNEGPAACREICSVYGFHVYDCPNRWMNSHLDDAK